MFFFFMMFIGILLHLSARNLAPKLPKVEKCPPHKYEYFNGTLKCVLCNRYTEDIIRGE